MNNVEELTPIIFIACGLAWLTHIITCLTAGKYLLLLIGAFMFPVGIIHGVGVWFGADW